MMKSNDDTRELQSRMNALRASNLSMNSHKGLPNPRNKIYSSINDLKNQG